MSVILGMVEADKIVIAGDMRASTKEGKMISDESAKVNVINTGLAMASAGSLAIENAIMMDVNSQSGKENMTTDRLVELIGNFYKRVVENKIDGIYALPFYCLIAGKGKDSRPHLINAGKFKNGFGAQDVPMALYYPIDVEQDKCNQIFAANYRTCQTEFCERTIRQISEISNVVSPTGSKWEYDILKGKGQLITF
ncbi:MAG: hypothetical protein PHN80_10070 [Hespellia sp.]|nr:hypothetical protein [Hespellia sp.]